MSSYTVEEEEAIAATLGCDCDKCRKLQAITPHSKRNQIIIGTSKVLNTVRQFCDESHKFTLAVNEQLLYNESLICITFDEEIGDLLAVVAMNPEIVQYLPDYFPTPIEIDVPLDVIKGSNSGSATIR